MSMNSARCCRVVLKNIMWKKIKINPLSYLLICFICMDGSSHHYLSEIDATLFDLLSLIFSHYFFPHPHYHKGQTAAGLSGRWGILSAWKLIPTAFKALFVFLSFIQNQQCIEVCNELKLPQHFQSSCLTLQCFFKKKRKKERNGRKRQTQQLVGMASETISTRTLQLPGWKQMAAAHDLSKH